MGIRGIAAAGLIAFAASAHASAEAFPLGFSAVGGIGYGYYSMEELNSHIGTLAQEEHISIDELASGVNFRVEGRLWILSQVALTGGYEHFWAETAAEGTSSNLSYRAPSDVYTYGVLLAVLRLENSFNFCVGVSGCAARSVFGMNELGGTRLEEFKGNDNGYEVYTEIHTNFINPVEVGFQLGYRGVKVETYSDKYGDVALFDPATKIEVDYGGVFFYLMTGIRL